jgi:hypothetical protein
VDCKDCIFTEWNKKVQTGCAANRLSKFIEMDKVELKTEDSTFYELKQFCNLYRPEDWKENKDADNLLNIALKQIKPRFGIVVHDSQEQDTNLNDTLESIKNINYDKSLIRIVISSFKNRGVQYLISKVVEMQNENFDCVMSMHLYSENEQLRDYECFSKLYKNSYFVKIPQGLKISPNLFSQIELSLNTKLEQIAFFEDQDENISAVPYGVVNNEYLNYNSYNKMLKGIKDVAKKNNKYIKYEN